MIAQNTPPPAITKDTFEVFVMLIDSIIWPLVLLIILILFRRNFANAIQRLGSLTANKEGLSLTFQSKLDRAKGLFSGLKPNGISKSSSLHSNITSGTGSPQEEVRLIHSSIKKSLEDIADQQGIDVSGKSALEICVIFKDIGVFDLKKAQMAQTLLELTSSPDTDISHEQVNELKLLYQEAAL